MAPIRDIEDVVGLSADARRLYDWMIAAFTSDVNEALALAKSHNTSISKWTHERLRKAHIELKQRDVLAAGAPELKPSQHHATKKKSPAQLQREIDEALARAPKKVAGFAMPATRQPGYQIVSVPILKGPRSIGPSGLDSPRERNESVVFATRAEAEAYLPSVKRFAADFGREAVIKEVW